MSPRAENNVDGVRMSTALTYINPNPHRLNLTIKPNAHVTRIQLEGKLATGVEVVSGGQKFTAEGNEIVLSAGAVGSPQLLMLSGLGPSEHLRSLEIPVAHSLPGVGQKPARSQRSWDTNAREAGAGRWTFTHQGSRSAFATLRRAPPHATT